MNYTQLLQGELARIHPSQNFYPKQELNRFFHLMVVYNFLFNKFLRLKVRLEYIIASDMSCYQIPEKEINQNETCD